MQDFNHVGRSRRSVECFRSDITQRSEVKSFVGSNITVVLFVLSFKNLIKPSRDISNNTIPYTQAECYTQAEQSYNYRLTLNDALRLMSVRHSLPFLLKNIVTDSIKRPTFYHRINCSILEKDN